MTLQQNNTNKLIMWLAAVIFTISGAFAGVIWSQLNAKIDTGFADLRTHIATNNSNQKEALAEIKALVQSNAKINIDQAIDIKLLEQRIDNIEKDLP